uniref:DAO domain-containing protein n=1 Tax=Meloidogyne hapla TaxID=6305 RepID=A0A1I8BW88_MELHA
MEKGPSSKKLLKGLVHITALSSLKIIFDLSKLQSTELDKAINETIYNKHIHNKRKTKKYKNAIVEGAGLIGLYAAYKLFMEGMNVTLVTGRSNRRNDNICNIEQRWLLELRFFLGTEFDKLFDKEGKSKNRLHDNYEVIGLVNLKNIGNKLKEHLEAKYNNENHENEEKPFFNFIYETSVSCINTDNEKPMAIPDTDDGTKGIPFDLFFYATRANDKFVRFLEKLNSVIFHKKFNKRIFKQDENKFNVKMDMLYYLNKEKLKELIKTSNFLPEEIKQRYFFINMLIAKGMKEDYETIKSQSSKTRTGKFYNVNKKGMIIWRQEYQNIFVCITETDTTIQIESKTPMAIVELIEEIKNEGKKLYNEYKSLKMALEHVEQNLNEDTYKIIEKKFKKVNYYKEMLENYKNFIFELKKRWFRALFNFVYNEAYKGKDNVIIKSKDEEIGETSTSKKQEHVLYFDTDNINKKTFLEEIYRKNPVKEFKGTKDSAIFADVVDTELSHNFMCDFSMYYVDSAVSAIKEYSESNEQKDLKEMLIEALRI